MISAHDQIRIAAHAIICQRTVLRVYQGAGNEYSRRRVTEAARQLGIQPPPVRLAVVSDAARRAGRPNPV